MCHEGVKRNGKSEETQLWGNRLPDNSSSGSGWHMCASVVITQVTMLQCSLQTNEDEPAQTQFSVIVTLVDVLPSEVTTRAFIQTFICLIFWKKMIDADKWLVSLATILPLIHNPKCDMIQRKFKTTLKFIYDALTMFSFLFFLLPLVWSLTH